MVTMQSLYTDLSLGAQTSYAELYDMAQGVEMSKFSTLRGSFHRREIKGRTYVYFNFRDTDNRVRTAYVGPDGPRVEQLIREFEQAHVAERMAALAQRSAACMALGCSGVLDKHFRIIHKIASYGFFRNGGVLIGTHAFTALGNMLGVRWAGGDKTMDVDFAHAGKNISVAMPANLDISIHDAITSLEMGLLPIREFSGKSGAQYRNPADPELRIDFCTPSTGSDEPVQIPGLGIALEPLKFMEFSLEGTTQGAIFSGSGACVVNLPDPARFAVHKLIVHGERPIAERAKATKDVEQAAALIEWHVDQGRLEHFQAVWGDALGRGPGWHKRAEEGRASLLGRHPFLAQAFPS
jgi:hypothetical protein